MYGRDQLGCTYFSTTEYFTCVKYRVEKQIIGKSVKHNGFVLQLSEYFNCIQHNTRVLLEAQHSM